MEISGEFDRRTLIFRARHQALLKHSTAAQ